MRHENLGMDGEQTVHDDWFFMVEHPQAPFQDPQHGYSVQFWIPHAYAQESMAAGAFRQYLWADRRQGTVVTQLSTGQPILFTQGESGAGADEFAAVMRALASREAFQ